MCGLNNIMKALKLVEISAAEIHDVAREMAGREDSLIYAQDFNMVLDLELDPRGNYAVDVLLHLLGSRTGLPCTRWAPGDALHSAVLLIGSGVHWQAVFREEGGLWYLYEQSHRNAVSDISLLLEGKVKNGAVYQIGQIEEVSGALLGGSLTDRLRGPTTREQTTPSPSSKRLKSVPREAVRQRAVLMEHAPMQSPDELLVDPPQFVFEGPQPDNTFDALMEAVSENSVAEEAPRPQRSRSKTQLYKRKRRNERKEKREQPLKDMMTKTPKESRVWNLPIS